MTSHLQRFFCKAGKEDKVVKDFVFISTNHFWQAVSEPSQDLIIPGTWDHYDSCQSIVLLGPPRQGKTSEFCYQQSKLQNGFFLPLRDLPTRGGLEAFESIIRDRERWQRWKEKGERGELFIDALDEGKLATRAILNDLAAWIDSLANDVRSRLRIHLSCRTADWQQLDAEQWNGLFIPPAWRGHKIIGTLKRVKVLSLLDLDRRCYQMYCESNGVDATMLLHGLPMRAKQFVARPQTLQMVVEQYAEDGRTPNDTKGLYDNAIGKKLDDLNKQYRRHQPEGTRAKREIAEFFASLTILSDRELVSTRPGPSQDRVHVEMSNFNREEINATLHSGLFKLYVEDSYRFDDPELSEYLAACRLDNLICSNAITPKLLLSLFRGDSSEEPVPKLRGTMVWLASLNKDFCSVVIKFNPGILLYDFPGELSFDDKLEIWKWLESSFADRTYFNDRYWREGIGVLACPEIVPYLKNVLLSPSKYGRDLRVLAADVARLGKLNELGETLELVVKNTSDNFRVLSYAGDALVEVAPDRILALKAWLDLKSEQDPENELLSVALNALWPDHLSLEEMIGHLRPQIGNSIIGSYWRFLYQLPNKLSADERAAVLDAMTEDLDRLVADIRAQRPQGGDSRASQYVVRFLLPQIEEWGSESAHIAQMERWISSALKAKRYSTLHFYGDSVRDGLAKKLDELPKLRQALGRQYIERTHKESISDPSSRIIGLPTALFARAEDLEFWKITLLNWLDRDDSLVEKVWYTLLGAWNHAGNPYGFIEWCEEQSKSHPKLAELWDSEKLYELPTDDDYWQRKNFIREQKEAKRRQEKTEDIQKHVAEIKSGHLGQLCNLMELEQREDDSIEDRFGSEVLSAYKCGLRIAWEKRDLPPLKEYYPGKHSCLEDIIPKAVQDWHEEYRGDWSKLPEQMRVKALQVSINAFERSKAFFVSIIEYDPETYKSFALEALKLENAADDNALSLTSLCLYNRDITVFRQVAKIFLNDNPTARRELILPLAKTLCTEEADEKTIALFWELAQKRFDIGDSDTGLDLISAYWRYEPNKAWDWLKQNLWKGSASREDNFNTWFSSVMSMHDLKHSMDWPSWAIEDHLIPILPELFRFYPPSGDPSVAAYNSGRHEIQNRSHIGSLRSSALQRLAYSGNAESHHLLLNMVSSDEFKESRDILLSALDEWSKAHATRTWNRLTPEELEKTLTQGHRPVRSHKELFELSELMLRDIRDDIQYGEPDISVLFWNESKPAEEKKIQSFFLSKLKNHPFRTKVVCSREVEVQGGNHPDITIQTWLPADRLAKIYAEVKRQNNATLFTAIENQLAQKYLIDPESRYGIYLVSWYGPKGYWRTNKQTVTNCCGSLPQTAQELEDCLQAQANTVVSNRSDIENIRVIVVDMSKDGD